MELYGMTRSVNNEIVGKDIARQYEDLNPIIKSFKKNDIILRASDDIHMVGIIMSGTAYLAAINLDFQKRILDYYEGNDIFYNSMISILKGNSYYIYAGTKCSVAFLDYREIIKDGKDRILKLQDHLLADYGKRSLAHIDSLSQRTLRNKLLSFFEYCGKQNASLRFTLPMSLSELADYLAVDRSAMMREIGKMKEEKLLQSEGRTITLLK